MKLILDMLATNASSERLFSSMKRIKTYIFDQQCHKNDTNNNQPGEHYKGIPMFVFSCQEWDPSHDQFP